MVGLFMHNKRAHGHHCLSCVRCFLWRNFPDACDFSASCLFWDSFDFRLRDVTMSIRGCALSPATRVNKGGKLRQDRLKDIMSP